MARAKTTGTAVANWDEELAKQAKLAADMEASAAGGQFFSIRAGVLTFGGNPMPDNKVAAIIISSVLENVFYEGEFDSDNPVPPTCYALGTNEKELTPHADVVAASNQQHATCVGCEWNEFGTAERGKGKACKNTRRVALLPAGLFNPKSKEFEEYDLKYLEQAAFGYLRLPVTSVRGYATYVKQMSDRFAMPPHAFITEVSVQPDPKNQVRVDFTPIGKIDRDWLPVIMKRYSEAQKAITFGYPTPDARTPKKAAPAKKAAAGKGKPPFDTKTASKGAPRRF